MLRTLALLAIIVGAVQGKGWTVPKLLVRFGLDFTKLGTEYYKVIPMTKTDAKSEGWETYTPPTLPNGLESLVLYCPEDKDLTACAYYDDTGYIAGMQYSFNKDCVYSPAFDMSVQGYSDWSVTFSNGTTNNYWWTAQYYVDKDYLATDSATRISSRSSTTILQCPSISFKGFNGDLYSVPTNTSKMISSGQFTEQACIPFMGRHYYYNMTNTTECTGNSLLPYFMLEFSEQYVGNGLMLFAKTKCNRNWYESPGKSEVELIVPTGPQCLYDMVDLWGLITIHTFVIDTPYYISCINLFE